MSLYVYRAVRVLQHGFNMFFSTFLVSSLIIFIVDISSVVIKNPCLPERKKIYILYNFIGLKTNNFLYPHKNFAVLIYFHPFLVRNQFSPNSIWITCGMHNECSLSMESIKGDRVVG